MRRRLKQLISQAVHPDESPYCRACGAAVGVFVAWTPTIGIQMIVAALLAGLLRGSKGLAIALVWISNPYTIVPIFWLNYRVGHALMGGVALDRAWIVDLITFDPQLSFIGNLLEINEKLFSLGLPLWIGSLIVGGGLGIVVFAAVYSYSRRKLEITEKPVATPVSAKTAEN